LRNQLDELTQSKKARETEMLEKFCALLNEKKVKIREQQRLLSTAHVDPSRIAAVQATQAARAKIQENRKPAASRRSKRKALEDASGGGPSSDSDDGFEKMAVDKMDVDSNEKPVKESKESNESEDRETTDDDATGSEPDEDEEPAPLPRKSRQPAKPAQKPEPKGHATRASQAAKDRDVAIHPPKRGPRATQKATSPSPADGSETESDDEL
jgi:hypothetical protein